MNAPVYATREVVRRYSLREHSPEMVAQLI